MSKHLLKDDPKSLFISEYRSYESKWNELWKRVVMHTRPYGTRMPFTLEMSPPDNPMMGATNICEAGILQLRFKAIRHLMPDSRYFENTILLEEAGSRWAIELFNLSDGHSLELGAQRTRHFDELINSCPLSQPPFHSVLERFYFDRQGLSNSPRKDTRTHTAFRMRFRKAIGSRDPLTYKGQDWRFIRIIPKRWRWGLLSDGKRSDDKHHLRNSPAHLHTSLDICGRHLHIDFYAIAYSGPTSRLLEIRVFEDGLMIGRGGECAIGAAAFSRGLPVAVELDDYLLMIDFKPRIFCTSNDFVWDAPEGFVISLWSKSEREEPTSATTRVEFSVSQAESLAVIGTWTADDVEEGLRFSAEGEEWIVLRSERAKAGVGFLYVAKKVSEPIIDYNGWCSRSRLADRLNELGAARIGESGKRKSGVERNE